LAILNPRRCCLFGKNPNPNSKNVHSQVLQDVVHRVDLAFRSFF